MIPNNPNISTPGPKDKWMESDNPCMRQSAQMERDDSLHAEEWVEKLRS